MSGYNPPDRIILLRISNICVLRGWYNLEIQDLITTIHSISSRRDPIFNFSLDGLYRCFDKVRFSLSLPPDSLSPLSDFSVVAAMVSLLLPFSVSFAQFSEFALQNGIWGDERPFLGNRTDGRTSEHLKDRPTGPSLWRPSGYLLIRLLERGRKREREGGESKTFPEHCGRSSDFVNTVTYCGPM